MNITKSTPFQPFNVKNSSYTTSLAYILFTRCIRATIITSCVNLVFAGEVDDIKLSFTTVALLHSQFQYIIIMRIYFFKSIKKYFCKVNFNL